MGTKCDLGEVEYKGICVPSYFTTEEKEQRYQTIMRNKKKSKNSGIYIALGIVALAAVFGYIAWVS